jgi:segregation and condensation protein A
MAYSITIQNFEGPLDLLLQLVEGEQMEITDISLVQVTEPFLRHLAERRGQMLPEELADFLLIASKLVYLKSKAIVPSLETDAELEGPDLASQLRAYQAFVAAAKQIQALSAQGVRSFSHPRQMVKLEELGFVAPSITQDDLRALFAGLVRRLEPIARLPQAAIERVMTLEEKMSQLVERVRHAVQTSFRAMAHEATSRAELIVTFLALLELTKQRSIRVEQAQLFEDIQISSPV